MAIKLQLRRGTTAENDLFTGALAEVTVDTDKNKLRVHDGSTQGGFPVALESEITDRISNCIIEIPQDINLTLSSGTLTLKAGSSAYMPNGSGVFTKCTSTANLTYSATWGAGYQCFVTGYVDSYGNLAGIGMCRSDLAFSGTTQPSTTINGATWYDTSVNKIKSMRNGSWVVDSVSESRTFFLGIVTVGTGNVITSIDQVFNGFGYIGSTVFALPGVKGLIPNGRNADGTLKNNSVALQTVLTYTDSSSTENVWLLGNASIVRIAKHNYKYDEENNVNINLFSNIKTYSCPFATGITNAGVISNFTTKTAFHAVDYSDYIKASGTVVAEQLPTSSNSYTWYRKYANGWVEQGGSFSGTVSTTYTSYSITLPVVMKENVYSLVCQTSYSNHGGLDAICVTTKSTTGFAVDGVMNSIAYGATWQVSGMAA